MTASGDDQPTRQRWRLVPIPALTGVVAVIGAVVLAVFLSGCRGPSAGQGPAASSRSAAPSTGPTYRVTATVTVGKNPWCASMRRSPGVKCLRREPPSISDVGDEPPDFERGCFHVNCHRSLHQRNRSDRNRSVIPKLTHDRLLCSPYGGIPATRH
jgi:hypothetical protein